MSFARLAFKMFPSLDLWILLDRSAIELQSRDEELSSAEAVRQVEQLRSFVESTGRFIILDASQPAETVQERAYAAIVNMLSERTNTQLKKRFNRFLP
jgi:thymidylate kinase